MDFDDYYNIIVNTPQNILERIDEYSIYCHYMGTEVILGKPYNSAVREGNADVFPSFAVYYSNKSDSVFEFWWKDHGTGKSGTIFSFVQKLYGYSSYQKAIDKVAYDFGLSTTVVEGKIITHTKPDRLSADIKITSKPFTEEDILFWLQFGITEETLNIFNIKSVKYIWYNNRSYPTQPIGLCFAYPENGYYKIYQPYNREYKFRTNYDERTIEGFHQLKYKSDTLIITKSKKDVMTLYEMGYEAVSPKSENTPIPEKYLNYFEKRYSNIITFFDNDFNKIVNSGVEAAKRYKYKYIIIPSVYQCKDVSDLTKEFGIQKAKQIIINLINAL